MISSPGNLKAALRRARFRSKVARYPVVRYRYLSINQDDCLLASYPRSGSTYIRFVLQHALTGMESRFGEVDRFVPYVGRHSATPRMVNQGRGRLIHTHERFAGQARRVVHLVRDPRDVALSELAWQNRRGVAPRETDRFIADLVSGRGNPWGSWGSHTRFWLGLEKKGGIELLRVRYEDLRDDPTRVFQQILGFLESPADSESALSDAIQHNSLERMRVKEREGIGPTRAVDRSVPFVGAGATEGWKADAEKLPFERIARAFGAEMHAVGY